MKNLLIVLFLLLTKNIFCQNVVLYNTNQQDTIQIYKPTIDTIVSFDSILSNSINVKVDTLDNRLGFLLDIYLGDFRSEQRIMLKRDDKFISFPILNGGDYREITTKIIHYDKSQKLLLIKYSNSSGLSFETHGYADYMKGIEIWNLDKIEKLALFEYYWSHLEWGEEITDPDISCYNYSFEIKEQTITFTKQNTCDDFDEGLTIPRENTEKITYKFTVNGLIREK